MGVYFKTLQLLGTVLTYVFSEFTHLMFNFSTGNQESASVLTGGILEMP